MSDQMTDQTCGTPVSDFVGMKNWDDEKRCWVGVVCRIELDDSGQERVVVYDVERADTQVEIDDWVKESIATKPWERDTGKRPQGEDR